MLEKGQILEINNEITIDKDYNVFSLTIPVGTLINNLVWFPQFTELPSYDTIKQIVYLGDYQWGVKHLSRPIEEFNKLHFSKQEDLLNNLMVSTVE
jgi:hypothetical protein